MGSSLHIQGTRGESLGDMLVGISLPARMGAEPAPEAPPAPSPKPAPAPPAPEREDPRWPSHTPPKPDSTPCPTRLPDHDDDYPACRL